MCVHPRVAPVKLMATVLATVVTACAGCSSVYGPGGADDCATLLQQFDTCGNSYKLTGDQPGALCRRYGDEQSATYFPLFPYPDGCRDKFNAETCCDSGADFYNGCAVTADKDPYRCLRAGAACDETTGLMTSTNPCGAADGGVDQ